MFELLAIDLGPLHVLIGAIGGLIATIGTIWLKNKLIDNKKINDQVENSIKLTNIMTSTIETLDGQIDRAMETISSFEKKLRERDDEIARLKQQLTTRLGEHD